MGLGRLEEASGAISKALKLNPNDANAHNHKAMLLFRLKRVPDALRESQCAIALDPRNVQYRDMRVGFLLAHRELQAALEEASYALAIEPNNAHLHSDVAHILFQAGKIKEALPEISKAIELEPAADYYMLRARLLLQSQKPAEAETDMTKAFKIQPDFQDCQSILLTSLCAQRKFESARDFLLSLLPGNKVQITDKLLCQYVEFLSNAGGQREALEVVNREIEAKATVGSPEIYAVRIGLYSALDDQLKVKKAVADYLEHSPDPVRDSQAIQANILSYRPYTMAHNMAMQETERLLEQASKSKRFGEAEQKKIDAAILKLNSGYDEVLAGLCDTCTREGDAFKLVTIIGDIKSKRPFSERLYCSLAQLQIRSANLSEAIACVSDGLKVYPNSVKLLEQRANLLSAMGRRQEARLGVKQVQRRGELSFTEESTRLQGRNMVAQFASVMNDDEQAAREVLEPALKKQREKLLVASNPKERSLLLLELAELEIVGKNYAEALKQAQESIKLDGSNPRAYELSSWALEGLEKPTEAGQARRMARTLFFRHLTR
jgi:Flp pilus assembly protein TadD